MILRDRLAALTAAASTDRAARPFSDGGPKLDFSVPGTSLSVRSVVNGALDALGLEQTHVSGMILSATRASGTDPLYRLILRSNKASSSAFFDGQGTFDDIIQRGALAVLQEHDPYTAASYLVAHGSDPESSLGFIYRLLARAKADEAEGKRKGDTSEVPWAYLVWGYALEGQQRWEAAANKFGEANVAYLEKHAGSVGWDLALDGRAYALLRFGSTADEKKRSSDEARNLLLHVRNVVNPNSISAVYHLALVSQSEGDFCAADELLKTALSIDHRYALALEARGIVYLEQATRIRLPDPDPASDRRPLTCLPQGLSEVEVLAERMLTEAIGLNPSQGPAWFQLGVLLFQQGDLEGAAAKFTNAVRLNPRDAHAWFRLGEARLNLVGKQGLPALKAAAEAYCRAAQLQPELEWHKAAVEKVAMLLKDDQVCAAVQTPAVAFSVRSEPGAQK